MVGDGSVGRVELVAVNLAHVIDNPSLRYRGPRDDAPRYAPLVFDKDEDRWTGAFVVDAIGRWTFTVDAWTDAFGSWAAKFEKKVAAGR